MDNVQNVHQDGYYHHNNVIIVKVYKIVKSVHI